MATITISIDLDDEPLGTLIEALRHARWDLNGDSPASSSAVLDELLLADLNDKEVAVLLALAARAPEPVAHEDLLQLCGSPQRYGNVMSGLARRWRTRADTDVATPWQTVGGTGYRVSVPAAEQIRAALARVGQVESGGKAGRDGPEPAGPPSNDWEQYEGRYRARPETYRAYVEVWQHDPGVREAFGGWASFSQAANNEPSQRDERVRLAEDFMRRNGYEIGSPSPHGGRRWKRS